MCHGALLFFPFLVRFKATEFYGLGEQGVTICLLEASKAVK